MVDQEENPCMLKVVIIVLYVLIFLVQILSCLVLLGVLCYCIKTQFNDPHIWLCTFGFHFLVVQAVLTMNTAIGCGRKARQRLYAHAVLQFLGIIFIILGLIVISVNVGFTNKTHGTLGLIATICAIISVILGIISFPFRRPFSMVHVILGIITLILSSFCLIYGLDSEPFRENFTFGERKIWKWMIFAIVVYTILMLIIFLIKMYLRFAYPCEDDYYDDDDNEKDEDIVDKAWGDCDESSCKPRTRKGCTQMHNSSMDFCLVKC